jgi:hypothetical protein
MPNVVGEEAMVVVTVVVMEAEPSGVTDADSPALMITAGMAVSTIVLTEIRHTTACMDPPHMEEAESTKKIPSS